MKQFTLLLLFSLFGNFLFSNTVTGFDLEVGVSVPNANPAIYSNVPVTVTATNAGTVAGTGIQIRVGVCGTDAFSFVQQNGLVFASTGSTATGTWDYVNQRWTIPNLAPGQTVTLTFSLFTLTSDPRSIQVYTQAANTPDVDSSPGNLPISGDLWICTANEDDEAVLVLNGETSACSITATVSNIQCHDNGTPGNAADDKFSFTLLANNAAPSTGYQVFISQTSQFFNGTYGSPLTIQNVPISTGNLTLSLTDDVTANCSASVNVAPPATCSGGAQLPDFNLNSFFAVQPVAGGGSEVVEPNDQVVAGTVLSFPDHFAWVVFPVQVPTFNVAVNAYLSTDMTVDASDVLVMSNSQQINASTQTFGFTEGGLGMGAIPANTPSGNYFLILKYDATNLVTESNEANNTRSVPIQVVGAQGGQIDLELQLLQTGPAPVVYGSYLVKATLKNTGSQTATGVKVSFKKPAGVVYTGGNEWTASQGSFTPFGNEEWTVGSIPAGGSVTLTVSYFLLQSSAPNAYAQVSAANQTDVDSSPNNGTPPTPNEDDEAATGTPVGGNLPELSGQTQEIIPHNICSVNPGQSFLVFSMMIFNNGTVTAGPFKVKFYFSTDNVLSNNDVFWVTKSLPSLNVLGSTGPAFLNITDPIPANLATGIYNIIMVVDADNEVVESNETNNQFVINFIHVGGPNIVLQSYTGLPATFSPGNNFNLSVHLSFAANGYPANTFNGNAEVQVVVGQTTVGSVTFPINEFAATGSVTKNVAVSLPANLAPGNYVLQVRVNDEICEQTFSDNFLNQNITVTGGGNPCNVVTITPGSGQITIAGAIAPHVLIKVFRPNWTVAFECLDNCGDPLVVNGLGAGTHHLQVKLLNSGWGQICFLEQDVTVASLAGNGGTALKFKNDRQRLAFDNIYPNPAQYFVTLEVFSKQDQAATLDFYNQQGLLMHTLEVSLDEGRNEVKLDVSEWKSGSYNVIGRGEGGMPAYGRFLKVWEE